MSKLRLFGLSLLFLLINLHAHADDKIYPDKPNPPRLVNDFAGMLTESQIADLESKLDGYARESSTQITIVTIKNLGGHDVEEYSVEVFNRWSIGQAGKNNGVLLLASLDDHKAWITVGKGLQGVLTDAKAGIIFRNELVPAFKEGIYSEGLSQTADAIIAVTKGEYSADGSTGKGWHIPIIPIILFLIVAAVFIIRWLRRGKAIGHYISSSGIGNVAIGAAVGNLLSSSGSSSSSSDSSSNSSDSFSSGDDDDDSGFGDFGGGSTDGGGAGGSW